MKTINTIKKAEQAHRNGKLDEAEVFYRQALAKEQAIDAIYGLATLKMQQNSLTDAYALFEQALSIEPFALDINFNYLLCLKQGRELAKASTLLVKLKDHICQDSQMVAPFAQAAFEIGAFSQVIDIISGSKHFASQESLLFLLIQAYMAVQHWPSAIEYLQQLRQKHPDNAQLMSLLAQCYGQTLNFNLAMPLFERLVTQNASADNLLRYADLCLLAQDKPKAELLMIQLDAKTNGDSSIEKSSFHQHLLTVKIKLARLNHDKLNAIKLALELLTLEPTNSLAWQVVYELGSEVEREKVAVELPGIIELCKKDGFDYRQNLYTLAKVYEGREAYDLAFNCFEQANQSQQANLAKQAGAPFDFASLSANYTKLVSIKYPKANAHLCSTKVTEQAPSNVFIVGMPRSGTTLVNRLLCQAPHVSSVNESNGIAASFETILNQKTLSELPSFLSENSSKFVSEYHSHLPHLPPETKMIVDKMPHNFRFVGAILTTFPDAKVVQMRRQPQDLALSIFSQQFNDYHNYACDLEAIAHAIFQANKLMDFWAMNFPQQVIDLSYEQLVSAPEEKAQEIYKFLSLDWQPSYLDFYQQAVPSFTFSEVQVRKPINRSKIGFARHYHAQLANFREIYSNLSR
ncbi:sulfotransferase family protein [Thalassotalea euphylliae]|uniref:Sulfotransferase family protein n=1 Tax=Thalassotalea euphylliae TaxID=1655234 RepID=A0A3E0TT24_9GAMM|nr:tetratricopeptide repeat-containing sulfotransferase family protein [Thalassotalea euphylliae]REL27574.1 sulfotransferase family protein [Thalassotalea euphylliae]